ncbi:sulfite exporter TauE/SafE family protein [Robertkochia flava]|uniref:sulfite exporter TauE/SafE family protein n=1 Tax=Robertkochia flava TaxID=3447986 RepID=UPI001CC93AF6|nr:sulfite exporter TauE/SafE family protein [Robertkochia marina]
MVLSGLILGFLGSLHCAGMCGPIAFVLPLDRKDPLKRFIQLMGYHLGRISSYALIGLFFGLLGRGLFISGMQQRLSLVLGVLMIVAALVPVFSTFRGGKLLTPFYMAVSRVKGALGERLKDRSPKTLYTLGVLNGFLPCGLVYMALFGAVAMGDALSGSAYMALFGAGTIPLMSVAAYSGNFLSLKMRTRLNKLIPVFVVLIGVLFVLRGLGLGIPYISPSDMNLMVKANPDCVVP